MDISKYIKTTTVNYSYCMMFSLLYINKEDLSILRRPLQQLTTVVILLATSTQLYKKKHKKTKTTQS